MAELHIRQIKSYLEKTFFDLLDFSDLKEDDEAGRLTRALAALALQYKADISKEDAAYSVTDGFHDLGIDAFYFDEKSSIVVFVQAKWSSDGSSTIDTGSAHKLLAGVNKILSGKIDGANRKILDRKTQIDKFLEVFGLQIEYIVVHISENEISAEVNEIFSNELKAINTPIQFASFYSLGQVDIHRYIGDATRKKADFEITINKWGYLDFPFLMYYGMISAEEVCGVYNRYQTRLFEQNIRSVLKGSEVNSGIVETLKVSPGNFPYYNNGITIVCSDLHSSAKDALSRDVKICKVIDAQVVNGAQTVSSIAKAKQIGIDISNVMLFARFIILPANSESLAVSITKASNTQNKIDRRDFVALDKLHHRIKNELKIINVDYVFRNGEEPITSMPNFTLEDATRALVALQNNIQYSALAKREIGKFYEDTTKEPYTRLFPSTLSSLKLYNLIRIFRKIIATCESSGITREGRERLYLTHGNVFIVQQAFQAVDRSGIDGQEFDEDKAIDEDKVKIIYQAILECCEAKHANAYLAHLFRNANKLGGLVVPISERIKELESKASSLKINKTI